MKKAQGISINVIIVAAIALIVLVVLVAVFTGKIGLFGKGIDLNKDTNISAFHHKTLCEVDPNAEGCICDEEGEKEIFLFTSEEYENGIFLCNTYQIETRTDGFYFCDSCGWNKCKKLEFFETTCIKAHEPNECEKGNDDWIEEIFYYEDYAGHKTKFCGNISDRDDMLYYGGDCNKFKKLNKLCRKKTIEGLSCEELKKAATVEVRWDTRYSRWDYTFEYIDRCGGSR